MKKACTIVFVRSFFWSMQFNILILPGGELMKFKFDFIVDEKLPRRINDFLTYIGTIKGKSQNTVKAYKTDLIVFFKFMYIYKGKVSSNIDFDKIDIKNLEDIFIQEITLEDLYTFISFCENYRENGNHAKARKVATLKSFFNYLHKRAKIIESNPATELETPKLGRRTPIFLNMDESLELLNNVSVRNGKRDYCILTLFLTCGLRLSELCNIDRKNIKEDTISIIGKGNKERTVYLSESTKRILDEYLIYRKDQDVILEKKGKTKNDALFLSERGNRIAPRTVEHMVSQTFKSSTIVKDKLSPHKLRHTAATLLYLNGVDIRSLKEILGHESISTTQIYTHVSDDKLKAAVNVNPLNERL